MLRDLIFFQTKYKSQINMDDVNIKDTPPPSEAPSVQETGSEELIKERVIHEESFSDGLNDGSPDNTIPLLVGVAVGILTLLLIYLFSKRRSLGRGMKINFKDIFVWSYPLFWLTDRISIMTDVSYF